MVLRPIQLLWLCGDSQLTTIFFLGKPNLAVNHYYMHILLLVTDNTFSSKPNQQVSVLYLVNIGLIALVISHLY